jgi:hypothetical protein
MRRDSLHDRVALFTATPQQSVFWLLRYPLVVQPHGWRDEALSSPLRESSDLSPFPAACRRAPPGASDPLRSRSATRRRVRVAGSPSLPSAVTSRASGRSRTNVIAWKARALPLSYARELSGPSLRDVRSRPTMRPLQLHTERRHRPLPLFEWTASECPQIAQKTLVEPVRDDGSG